jgi:hypothetical protein
MRFDRDELVDVKLCIFRTKTYYLGATKLYYVNCTYELVAINCMFRTKTYNLGATNV